MYNVYNYTFSCSDAYLLILIGVGVRRVELAMSLLDTTTKGESKERECVYCLAMLVHCASVNDSQ